MVYKLVWSIQTHLTHRDRIIKTQWTQHIKIASTVPTLQSLPYFTAGQGRGFYHGDCSLFLTVQSQFLYSNIKPSRKNTRKLRVREAIVSFYQSAAGHLLSRSTRPSPFPWGDVVHWADTWMASFTINWFMLQRIKCNRSVFEGG